MKGLRACWALKKRRPVERRVFVLLLNDKHQGEGGTLVFVAVYITMSQNFLQEQNR